MPESFFGFFGFLIAKRLVVARAPVIDAAHCLL